MCGILDIRLTIIMALYNMPNYLVIPLAILSLLSGNSTASFLVPGSRFHKLTNSNQDIPRSDKFYCASTCRQNSRCKGFGVKLADCPQCVTYDEEILTNTPESITLDFWLKECPEGFVSGVYKYQCYLFIQTGHSWNEALRLCESKNSYLAELIDAEERDTVWNYAKDHRISSGLPSFWLGIVQRDVLQKGHNRDFKFYKSDTVIPSTNVYWHNRYMSDEKAPEACGRIRINGENSKFHDEPCDHSSGGLICEW